MVRNRGARYRWWLLGVLLSLLTAGELSALSRDSEWLIRVGLERGAFGEVIYVRAQGGSLRWVNPDTGQTLLEAAEGTLWQVRLESGQLVARSSGARVSARRLHAQPVGSALLTVGTDPNRLRRYRGALEWVPRDGKLLTLNWVRLDDYLKAVLPMEMPPNFPMEALKAQAVASRSFTLKRLNRYRQWGYDLCDHAPCQVYGGVDAERPTTNQAVESTAGEVLYYNGAVLEAVYTGNCGGHTAPIELVMAGTRALEPLQGVPDTDREGKPYCNLAPNSEWRVLLTRDALQKAFPQVGAIRSLTIEEQAPSGYVARLKLVGEKATLTLTGAEFRARIGATVLRSQRFTLQPLSDGWEAIGRGSGHGAGLCQWGANGRARARQTYAEILQAYYPNTTLGKW
ncbi:MAG: SpoIID/LytB domain-containing protein [Armatimonadetes bacterium]|nr:SpoIID/LytB domain-containing protein [Armatimonadota bacterium]CUU34166.1 stage II sporulation protein D [Armatimonadetes bacterium DC]